MKYKLKKIGINLLLIAGLSFGCYSIFTTLLPTLFGHGSSSAFDMGNFFYPVDLPGDLPGKVHGAISGESRHGGSRSRQAGLQDIAGVGGYSASS